MIPVCVEADEAYDICREIEDPAGEAFDFQLDVTIWHWRWSTMISGSASGIQFSERLYGKGNPM